MVVHFPNQTSRNMSGTVSGPAELRSLVTPQDGLTYFESNTGITYRGDGVKWVQVYPSLNESGHILNQYFRPLASTLRLTPPAFDALITVPSSVRFRLVFGSAEVQASNQDAASIEIEVENDSGVMTRIQQVFTDRKGTKGARQWSYGFIVPGGKKYRFKAGQKPDVVEEITDYSFVDV